MLAPGGEEWISADDEPACPCLDQIGKGCIEFAVGAGIENMKLDAESLRRRKKFLLLVAGKTGVGWVYQQAHDTRRRKHLMQQLQQLRRHLCVCLGHARDVAPWAVEAGDKAEADGVGSRFK